MSHGQAVFIKQTNGIIRCTQPWQEPPFHVGPWQDFTDLGGGVEGGVELVRQHPLNLGSYLETDGNTSSSGNTETSIQVAINSSM